MTPKTPPYPVKWRTKQGKLTRAAARYVNHRTAEHYRYIRDNILERK